MPEKKYSIRAMHRLEVDIAIEWAAKEGWNPGFNDAECYISADPQGFLIGLLEDEPVACISVVKYTDSFGFLGFYIVKPEYRGKGYGMKIWNAGISRLQGCNIGLDGVVDQQNNYKKSGFKLAYRNIRYQGFGGGQGPSDPGVIGLDSLDFSLVEAYDKPCFPAPRSQFLQAWIKQPCSRSLGIMQDGKLAGYGVIRQCREGYKIGPLLANTTTQAESLFLALKTWAGPSATVFLDVPEINPYAVALAERHGMQVSFETARMYTGKAPDIPLGCIYGVTSFEVG